MKKVLFVFIILTFCINSLNAQTEKTIDKKGGNIYYGKYTTEIKSEKNLPENIQNNVKGYLNRFFPTMIDSITFSHGQIIDLGKIFKEEPKTYDRFRIIPKYELTFYLKNKSLGITNYNLEIGLDDYGQILETNWPKEILNFNNFKSIHEIKNIVLKHVEQKKIEYKTYEIDLVYKKEIDNMFWIIKLHIDTKGSRKEFYIIEIAWNSKDISAEFTAYQDTLY